MSEKLNDAKLKQGHIKESLLDAERLAAEAQERLETTDFAALATQDNQAKLNELQKSSDIIEAQQEEIAATHEIEMQQVKARVGANEERTSKAQERKDAAQENIKSELEKNEKLKAELIKKQAEFDSLNSSL